LHHDWQICWFWLDATGSAPLVDAPQDACAFEFSTNKKLNKIARVIESGS
jgi:hypothetical protein